MLELKKGLESIFEETKLIDFLKDYEVSFVDVNELDNVREYQNSTYNDFDREFGGRIYLNNQMLICFSYDDNHKPYCKIGRDSGWVGGLDATSINLAFNMDDMSFKSFKKGFIEAYNNPQYSLTSMYYSSCREVIFTGTLAEVKERGIAEGYTFHESSYEGGFGYFEKDNYDKMMNIYVFPEQIIKNINSTK
jgi:hypothetical protein